MHDKTFEKISFKEKYPEHYAAEESKVTETITHDFNYMTIAGTEHPQDSKRFNSAVQLLEWLSFTMKFRLKNDPPQGFFDYNMPPTETVRKNMDKKKEDRKRKIFLPLPSYIEEARVVNTRRVAQAKTDEKLPQMRFQKWKKRKVIQILHIWAYGSGKRKVNKLNAYAKKHNLEIKWDYQEVYLNDMRRTKPDNLETIIRFDVKKAKAAK